MSQLLTPLCDHRIIEITGPDTEKFLQGQLSADIGQLALRGHLLGAHCNIKGHIIGLYRIIRIAADRYWLRISTDTAEVAFNTLKKYSIFSKVQLQFNDELKGLGCDSAMLKQALPVDQEPAELTLVNNIAVLRIGQELYELWGTASEIDQIANQAKDLLSDMNQFVLAQIGLGIPDLRAATQEHFIPQFINLQALDGVSFTKGCYTGQEIVTRLQHRGILKRAMYRFGSSAATLPEPGSAIIGAEGTEVGEVVLAAQKDDQIELLAVIQQAQIDQQTQLQLSSGEPLTRLTLPYTLDPELFKAKR